MELNGVGQNKLEKYGPIFLEAIANFDSGTVKGYQGDTTSAAISIHISKTYDVGVKVDAEGQVQFVRPAGRTNAGQSAYRS